MNVTDSLIEFTILVAVLALLHSLMNHPAALPLAIVGLVSAVAGVIAFFVEHRRASA